MSGIYFFSLRFFVLSMGYLFRKFKKILVLFGVKLQLRPYFGYKNSFISAIDSFLTKKTSELCIQVIKKTRVKIISQYTFLHFIQKEKETLTLWQQVLSEILLRQIEREKDLLISSPFHRYQRVLKRHPLLFQEIPHKYIASYLRMTPETLSRMQKS